MVGDELSVVLVKNESADVDGVWMLPGTFLHEGETLAQAVLRSLRDKARVTGRVPRQLHVFDDPHRDDRGWVLSVAHLDIVAADELSIGPDQRVRIAPVGDTRFLGDLPYDHAEIVRFAVERARESYIDGPDPGGLLGAEPFTLRDLRHIHEAVLGRSLQRDTFRRAMDPKLEPTGELTDGTRGRPSRLWRIREYCSSSG